MSKPIWIVTVSGGRTSAFMAYMLLKYYGDIYHFIFIFCNTGEEHPKTLEFLHNLEVYWKLPLVWLEAVAYHGEKKSSGHKIVTYETAARNGEPFRDIIAKYGIVNQNFPFCTRELKLNPIKSYLKSLDLKVGDYITAVGIRSDEAHRIRKDYREARISYPLIYHFPSDKTDVNDFWEEQPFRLELPEHLGNCKTCYKKSFRKLFMIIDEHPEYFDFNREMEKAHFATGAGYDPIYKGGRGRVFFRTGLSTDELFALREASRTDGDGPKVDPDANGGCTEECGINDEL